MSGREELASPPFKYYFEAYRQSDVATRYVAVNTVGIPRVPTDLIRKQKHTTFTVIQIKPNCQHASLRLHQQFLLHSFSLPSRVPTTFDQTLL
jgi:hypothetical protein